MLLSLRHMGRLLRTTLWEICFPAELTNCIDPFVRYIFTIYHLPPIALVIALTHSALERIVWVLIIPVAREMEKQPYNSSHFETLLLGLCSIIVQILPFTTLGLAVATIGHKFLNCFVETMIDAYSKHDGKDYPLLAARLRFMLEDKERYYTFLIVLCVIVSIVLSILYTNILVTWPDRDRDVVKSAWCIIFLQVSFVVGSVINNLPSHIKLFNWKRIFGMGDGELAKYFYDIWWESYIHYMRYIAIEMVVIIAIISLFFQGPLYVLSSSAELIMYLNIPHLLGHSVMSISTTVINLKTSLYWLRKHFDALFPVILVALPYQLMLFQAMFYFRHHWMPIILFLGVNILLCTRAIDLVREFDVTEHGSVHWKYVEKDKLLSPHLSIILEDAYEAKLSQVSVVSLDLLIDIKSMKLYSEGKVIPVERTQIVEYGNAQNFLRNGHFYAYAVPRLLSVQSPGYFCGNQFRRVRVLLRMISIIIFLIFATLVGGMLLQAAFPQLRPWPVRVYTSDDKNSLIIDHIVVRMQFLSNKFNKNSNFSLSFSEKQSALDAFKWNNATGVGEDWYPALCTRSFYNISIWEISLLALLPYLYNNDEVNEMLNFMSRHMGTDWVIRERHGSDCVSHDSSTEPTGWDGYFDFYSAKNDISIIAIRGTDMTSFQDFLTNVNIFFDVVLYHILSNIVPGAAILPSELIADLLRVASLPATNVRSFKTWDALTQTPNSTPRMCGHNNHGRDFFVDAVNHLHYTATRARRPRGVVVTGHSLGGAVASIIGAQLGVQAVGFSAPGIALSRKKYDIDPPRLHPHLSVTPSHDIFPMIGGGGGEEHRVECLAVTRELCHAMEFVVGTLWRSCGSIRARYPSIVSVI